MEQLMSRIGEKAARLHIPLNAHLDVTWRCNEGCGMCYLDHSVGGDMSTAEIKKTLDELAAAGALFLTLSGGEIMLRKDIFEIVAYARKLQFDVRLKTNGILVGEDEARRFAELGVREVHISIYSHKPEVHDGITRVPGSLERSLNAARHFRNQGLTVELRCPIMQPNAADYREVHQLALDMGVKSKFDAMVTPMMDGDRDPVDEFHVNLETLTAVIHDPLLAGNDDEKCGPPAPPDESALSGFPCTAGHAGCYITPQGDVTPCVQFPMVCGNLRTASFTDIWYTSPDFLRLRELRSRDVAVCNTCSNFNACNRCPGLAYMEGDMAGPSSLDCAKAYARTGVPSPLTGVSPVHAAGNRHGTGSPGLVQLSALRPAPPAGVYSDAAAC